MDLRLGLVGRGYWGNTYAKVLEGLGIEFWQAGRDWTDKPRPDGLIIASKTASHYAVAREALCMGLPVLIEKPACLRTKEVMDLQKLGGIAFVGHTRLYDPTWRAFKREIGVPKTVEAFAGGVNVTNPEAHLNWWHHLVPMCLDLAFDPEKAVFHITEEKQPL